MRSYDNLVDLFFEYIDYLKNNQSVSPALSYQDKEFDLLFNNKTLFDQFYNDIIKQQVYDSSDNNMLFKMFTDWYSSLSNIITQHQFTNNALQATSSSLDDLINSYGMPYYYWIPNSNKSQFFLNQVSTYHIKGSATAISSSLSYFLNIENEIYEYWVIYDKSHNDLLFKGYPAIKNNDIHTMVPYILKNYAAMDKEPHWYYTKAGILYKQNQPSTTSGLTTQPKLPSMSPFFDVVMAAKLEETKKAYLYISYLAWCQLQKWNSTGDLSAERVWDYAPSNQKLSILEVILAYDILYNKKYNRILAEDLSTGRDTYNVPCGNDKDQFNLDYEDAFGIIDITNTEHDDFIIHNMNYGGAPDRLETIVIEDKLTTKNQPSVKLQETNAIIYDMKAIIPGGLDTNGNVVNTCTRFDLYNQSWEDADFTLPVPLRNHCVIQNDNFMFIIGGITNNNEFNKHIFVLDLINEQWYQMPYNFPVALIDFSYVMINEYEVFIVCGFDLATASFSNKTYILNLKWGTMTALDDYPGTSKIKMGLSIDQKKQQIFMSGGWHNALAYSESYIYDLRTNNYINVPNDLEKRACNYIVYDGEKHFVNLGGLTIVDNLSESFIENYIDSILYQFQYRRGTLTLPDKINACENYDFDPNINYDDYVIIENPVLTTVDINTLVETDIITNTQYTDENNYRPTLDTTHDRNNTSYNVDYLEVNEYVPFYLEYLDALRLFYKPVFHETSFDLSLWSWGTLSYDAQGPIIDTSYPNVQHLYHNIFILQPIIPIIDGLTGLQTGLDVSNDVYVKRFTKEDKNWFDFNQAIIETINDPNNTSRREEYETKLGVRMAIFSKNSPMFTEDESANENLLNLINPDLYNFVMQTITAPDDEYNNAIYYLLMTLDDIAGFYGYQTSFRLLNINAMQELLTKVVDFYKPIHSRQMVAAVIVLPFNNRTYNSVYIDDYLRVMANIYGEDYYSVEDNYMMKINMDLKERIQWAYDFDYWFPDFTYNEWDWYTVYEELYMTIMRDLNDHMVITEDLNMTMTNVIKEDVNITESIISQFNYNEWNWYTVYEELYMTIMRDLDDHIVITEDLNMTMTNDIKEDVSVTESITPKFNIVAEEKIEFANNYDENLQYDNYIVQENLDIQVVNI